MHATRRQLLSFVRAAISLLTIAGPCLIVSRADAADIVFPGIHPQMGAGAGQTVSRGASAVFYNPANMIYTKFIEPYADVGFAQTTYTYQHTNTENAPAVLKTTSIPFTGGLSIRPTPSIVVGGAMASPSPTGTVNTMIGVPVDDAGTLMDFNSKRVITRFAAGGAFRIDHWLTVGAGMIMTSEKAQLLVIPQDAEEPYIDALYAGSSNQFIGGVRSELFERKVVVALSYRTAAARAYKGDILVNETEDSDYVPYEGVGYSPGAIGFGSEARFGDFGVYFDFLMEQWSAGRAVAKTSLGAPLGYVDANNIVAGAKLWFGKHMLTAAGGMYAPNIGPGPATEAATGLTMIQDETTEEFAGMGVGDIEGIQRIVAGGGYRYKLQDHGYFESGVMYQTGNRVIPEGAPAHGKHTLSVLTVSGGMAFGF